MSHSIEHVFIVYTCNTLCNALVRLMYSLVSGQYSFLIQDGFVYTKIIE